MKAASIPLSVSKEGLHLPYLTQMLQEQKHNCVVQLCTALSMNFRASLNNPTHIQPLDMFAGTPNLEVMILLSR